MSNSITSFGANFYGGTRRHSYRVNCVLPTGKPILEFNAYAFALPASIINEIGVPYRGRNLYIPGDRDYQPFTLSILDDTGSDAGSIYSNLMEWQRSLNDHLSNTSDTGPNANRQVWTLEHLDYYTETPIKKITLKGVWPVSVGPVVLSSASKNEFMTFDTTVRYDYFEIDGSITGSASNGGNPVFQNNS
jgi:hypothetical protein